MISEVKVILIDCFLDGLDEGLYRSQKCREVCTHVRLTLGDGMILSSVCNGGMRHMYRKVGRKSALRVLVGYHRVTVLPTSDSDQL